MPAWGASYTHHCLKLKGYGGDETTTVFNTSTRVSVLWPSLSPAIMRVWCDLVSLMNDSLHVEVPMA